MPVAPANPIDRRDILTTIRNGIRAFRRAAREPPAAIMVCPSLFHALFPKPNQPPVFYFAPGQSIPVVSLSIAPPNRVLVVGKDALADCRKHDRQERRRARREAARHLQKPPTPEPSQN